MAESHTESDGTYGVPRVTAELKDVGVRVNHKRVAFVRKFNIVGLRLRKKVRTTIPEPSATPVRICCGVGSPRRRTPGMSAT